MAAGTQPSPFHNRYRRSAVLLYLKFTTAFMTAYMIWPDNGFLSQDHRCAHTMNDGI